MAITKPVNSGYTVVTGSTSGSNGSNVETWLEYKVLSQDGANAQIRVLLYAASPEKDYITAWTTEYYFGYVQCNGGDKQYYKSTYSFAAGNINLFADYTFTIADSGSGTSVTLSGSWETTTVQPPGEYGPFTNSSHISGGSVSATFTLPVFYQKTIILTFDTNGGTGAPDPMSATVYSEGAGYTFTIPSTLPTKTGYNCLGWSLSPNSVEDWYPGDTITVSGDTTLYAVYEAIYYIVDVNGLLDGTSTDNCKGYGTFDVYINGSLAANDVSDYCAEHPYGTAFEITDIKVSTGKTYLGVSSGSLFGTVVGNMTTQLNFKTNTYQVIYDANGGSGNMEPSTATYGEEFITHKNAFIRSGYEFNGWIDDHGAPWTLTSSGVYESGKSWVWTYTEGRILYAQWKPKAEMFAKDGDHYRRGLAKVKHDGKWRDGATIYKKINGHWKAKN